MIGRAYSLEYSEIPKAFFTTHSMERDYDFHANRR
jgi:hypothetical protein